MSHADRHPGGAGRAVPVSEGGSVLPGPWRTPVLRRAGLLLLAAVSAGVALHVADLAGGREHVVVPPASLLAVLPWIVFLYGTAGFWILRHPPFRGAFALFSVAFLLRLGVALLLAYTVQFDDERLMHVAGSRETYGLFSWRAGRGYYHVVNNLYHAWGANLMVPKALNVALGALMPFLAWSLARRLFGDDAGASRRALLLVAFLPPLVLYSGTNLKELPTALLLLGALWSLVVPRAALWKAAGFAASAGVLYWLRGAPWTLIAVLGAVVWLAFGREKETRLGSRSWIGIGVGLAVVAVAAVPLLLEPALASVTRRMAEDTYYMERFTASRATVMQFVDVENPLAPRNLAVLFVRGLFSPSPLRFLLDYDLDAVLEAVNMLVWYLLFPVAAVAYLDRWRRGGVAALAAVTFAILVVATVGVMVGSAPYRHRIVLFAPMAVLVAGGLRWSRLRALWWVPALWGVGAVVFNVLWLRLRW